MKGISGIPGDCCATRRRHTSETVERVADQRVPGSGEMDPHLVGPSGLDRDLREEISGPPLKYLHRAGGGFAQGRRRVKGPERGVFHGPDRHVDPETRHAGFSRGQRTVPTPDATDAPRFREGPTGLEGPREDDHSGGEPAQAMSGNCRRIVPPHLVQQGAVHEVGAG